MIVLNLEWSSYPSRDRESATLVCNYLRYQNIYVIEGCIFNAFFLIFKHKPNALYMSNIVGARINFIVAKYANSLGIPVFTSHAEGDFAEENITEFVWGHNYEKEPIERKIFFWSKRNADLANKYFPETITKTYITGSPGHDKYKIESIVNKKEIKTQNNIGIACYDFSFTNTKHALHSKFTEETIKFFYNQCQLFDEILYKIAKNNPKLSFYIKEHPGNNYGIKYSGFQKTSSLNNVIIIDKDTSILNFIININTIISYQSNTSLESWLIGNYSITLNPKTLIWPKEFYRTSFHECQLTCTDYETLNKVLNNLNKQPIEEKYIKNRKKMINDIIGFDDGLNHVRIGNQIINDLLKPTNFFKYDYLLIKYNIIWILKYILFFLKNHSYSLTHILRWNSKELKKYQSTILKKQLEFYKIEGLDSQSLKKIV